MNNWDTDAARRYHEQTKHSYESIRASQHRLDWTNRPHPFKEYVGIEAVPFLEEPPGADEPGSAPSFSDLAWLLRWGAGLTRTRRLTGETYSFRTYSSAGALYPVEVYAACGDLPGLAAPGLYHFHPGEPALRHLRQEDVRATLAAAAAEPSLGEAGIVLVLTGILWRTAWKYQARGYRHLYWDAGTMLANLLALAGTAGYEAQLVTGFVDADVNRVLGIDGEAEAALALLAVGRGARAVAAGPIQPLDLEVLPVSRKEQKYPEAHALHSASSLATPEEVQRYRAGTDTPRGRPSQDGADLSPEALVRVLRRRGSVRDFAPDAVAREELVRILTFASASVPADVGPWNELYLIANAVDDLEPGAYRFEPSDRLELLRPGSFRLHAGFLALEQPLGARAAATTFLMADLERVLARHGNRGYRAAQLEAGIRAGRIYIGAFARGLGATASTFYDDAVTEFFVPGTSKSPMLCAALGRAG